MNAPFETRILPLSSAWFRKKTEEFLLRHGLRLDDVPEIMLGLYDCEDHLVGCAGLDINVIKYVAISEELRGMNATSTLLSPLVAEAHKAGYDNIFLFTKPENENVFRGLGFHTVGSTPKALMMETDAHGIDRYCHTISALAEGRPDPVGVVVINANPLTKGHLHLLRHAADNCATLVVIPLAENILNTFRESDRIAMIQRALDDIPNAIIAPPGPYAISSATFPSYFIKRKDEAAEIQMRLELDIFCRKLAPALRATVRFVGSENTDLLTRQYNEIMKETLPKYGISLDEIDRLTDEDGRPYSASAVRKNIREDRLRRALSISAPQAVPAVLAEGAAHALKRELELTPKPGLVDLQGNDSHPDMNVDIMRRSIDAIRPYFRKMADVTYFETQPKAAQLTEIGREAEEDMMRASGGINTHRGALFSLGITVASAARIIAKRAALNEENLRLEIAVIAEALPASKGITTDSNGRRAISEYHIKGAHACACEAYPLLFDSWLPKYRSMRENADPNADIKLLLLIISQLDDTNVYHRAGREGAEFAHNEAAALLEYFSEEGVIEMKKRFAEKNISCGGAADMFALTIFIFSLLNTTAAGPVLASLA